MTDNEKDYKILYKCPACSDLHDEEWDAQNCCEPEAIYICNHCDSRYHRQSDAEECCPTDEGVIWRMIKRKLEEAGQGILL